MKFKVEIQTLRRVARYLCALAFALAASLFAQSFSTTTVQGTVYLASGRAAAGTVQISWPAFTTAAGQAVAAGRTAVQVGTDGFLSVGLAPNQGATPAGLYYTVVYNLSDGSTSTEYRWRYAGELFGVFCGRVCERAIGVVSKWSGISGQSSVISRQDQWSGIGGRLVE